MLKNAYFLGKIVKLSQRPFASGARGGRPRVVTPAYYYRFVEFVLVLNAFYSAVKEPRN